MYRDQYDVPWEVVMNYFPGMNLRQNLVYLIMGSALCDEALEIEVLTGFMIFLYLSLYYMTVFIDCCGNSWAPKL